MRWKGDEGEWYDVWLFFFFNDTATTEIYTLSLHDALPILRGPVGSEIIITVVREGETEPFDVSIIRDTIKLTAVRSRNVGDTVILRITTFSDQTFPSMRDQLAERVEDLGGIANVNGFVLDLRNNPGGLLT